MTLNSKRRQAGRRLSNSLFNKPNITWRLQCQRTRTHKKTVICLESSWISSWMNGPTNPLSSRNGLTRTKLNRWPARHSWVRGCWRLARSMTNRSLSTKPLQPGGAHRSLNSNRSMPLHSQAITVNSRLVTSTSLIKPISRWTLLWKEKEN